METTEEIVDDIRAQNQGLPEDSIALSPLVADMLSLADRIESEHNAEMETTRIACQSMQAKFDDAVKLYQLEMQQTNKLRREKTALVLLVFTICIFGVFGITIMVFDWLQYIKENKIVRRKNKKGE